MNVVLVIFDTLRRDHVGAYGNPWIHTPHLDAIAREAVRFTRAYPESLPTLPYRRAIHTGQRTFPFRGHRDLKGDFGGAPGWGPMHEDQDALAELLQEAGYRTALITDCYHQFKPSKNFHRGFGEWVWVRGQETDRFRSGPALPAGAIAAHVPGHYPPLHQRPDFFRQYLTNNLFRRDETDYYPARVFGEASRWVRENLDAEKFFLVVDSFDPHEPWEPPATYRRLYDPDDDVTDVIQSLYAPHAGVMTPRELRRLQANYAGEVTLCDRWFGEFMETLRLAGRLDDTLVIVISDHGHNLGLDPGDKGLVSKQGHPMTHAVADLVLLLRRPDRAQAGQTYDGFVTNTDVAATILASAGVDARTDGADLWPAVIGREPSRRTYVSIAWGPLMTVIDHEWWCNATIWGEEPLLYRVQDDPRLERNLATQHPEVVRRLIGLAVHDAGGTIPAYFSEFKNKPGCTPYLTRIQQGAEIRPL
ncbi:MAG: sulfatase [Actinobacteria bacterium]|nr:sulfatase [Actinomycetota bacterium]